MSINVTVKGNPISIKRGRMITAEACSSMDFEKRRLMRLEQVRQQSKQIAEDVRNRVRREKQRQLAEIERNGEAKLKNWQHRKLLEIQNQYTDALREIGLGHKQANKFANEKECEEETSANNAEIAKKRGQEAAKELDRGKNKVLEKETKQKTQKMLSREIGKFQSKINRPNKVASANINISVPVNEELEESCNSDTSHDNDEDIEIVRPVSPLKFPKTPTSPVKSTKTPISPVKSNKTDHDKTDSKESEQKHFVETRISDRIKQRQLLTSQDVSEPASSESKVQQQKRKPISANELDDDSPEEPRPDCFCCPSKCLHCIKSVQDINKFKGKPQLLQTPNIPQKIPEKPPIKIIDSVRTTSKDSPSKKIHYYDHANKFQCQTNQPKRMYAEKITSESMEVLPNILSDEELHQKTKQRDRDAVIRGNRALQKEKVHRDYQELMKQLPLLQKKERISEINSDKQKYHMGGERLKELERKRQNELENAFARRFPQEPAIVTLPSRKAETTTSEAKWDLENIPSNLFSPKEIETILEISRSENPRKRLKQLLQSLEKQKQKLVQEINYLPDNESIFATINATNKSRCRKLNGEESNSTDTTESVVQVKKQHKKKKVIVSPAKRPRNRPVLVLQNTSTQTTPKPSPSKSEEAPKKLDDVVPKTKCQESHVPCNCALSKDKSSTDELCQIVIKIHDGDESEVVVKPKNKDAIKLVEPKPKSTKIPAKETKIAEQPIKINTATTKTPQQQTKSIQTSTATTTNSFRTKSWREELSKNSNSTSTSYMSPPDFSGLSAVLPTKHSINTLRGHSSETQIPEKLKKTIKQLLEMKRSDINELSVSSSSIATPSESLMEVASNKPLSFLHELIRTIKIRVEEVDKELSTPSETNLSPCSLSNCREAKTQQSDKSGSFVSPQTDDNVAPPSVRDDVLIKYSDITESYSKRISDLTSKIEKVRKEKEQLLISGSNSPSFPSEKLSPTLKDLSTAYLELPDMPVVSDSNDNKEDEIDTEKNMKANEDLANQLRDFAIPSTSKEEPSNQQYVPDQIQLARLQKLINEVDQSDLTVPKTKLHSKDYVPFLSDIPKLPKLEPSTSEQSKRPPLSKGLMAARRLNGTLKPHELSTIIEADSQLSTKIDLERSPKKPSTNPSDDEPLSLKDPLESSTPKQINSPTQEKTPIQTLVAKEDPKSAQSTSSSSINDIEEMLRSIGMEWAIPTLHKTQEALAMVSSSSSTDLDITKSGKKSNSSSTISLKDFLKQHLLAKSSSSSLKSDIDTMSFLEVSELSAILSKTIGNSSANKSDKLRTSTPVISGHSTNKSTKLVQFSDDSEISSVRVSQKSSDKCSFYSLNSGNQSSDSK